jgi:hypothetical protein
MSADRESDAELRAWARELVATFPPLSEEQKSLIADVFRANARRVSTGGGQRAGS